MIADHYAPFLPRPWFIGEMGFNGASASDITTQLTEMNECTSEGEGFPGLPHVPVSDSIREDRIGTKLWYVQSGR